MCDEISAPIFLTPPRGMGSDKHACAGRIGQNVCDQSWARSLASVVAHTLSGGVPALMVLTVPTIALVYAVVKLGSFQVTFK